MDLVSQSITLVVSIINAVDNVTTLRDVCATLGSQLKTLHPFLSEVMQQLKAQKPLSTSNENVFKDLVETLTKGERIVKKLGRTNRVKMAIMATSLAGDLSEVTNSIQLSLGSLNLMTLGIAAEMKDDVTNMKTSLKNLTEEFKQESGSMAAQLKQLEKKILDAMQPQGLIPTAEPVQVLAAHFNTYADAIKSELQDLKNCRDWQVVTKEAAMEQLFEQLLIAIAELDQTSCQNCYRIMPELECTICKEPMTHPVLISSGYTYCRPCIVEWFKTHSTCPRSQQNVSKELIENKAVKEILNLSGADVNRTRDDALPLDYNRLDVSCAAKEFQSGVSGSIIRGLISLRAQSETFCGKREIISTNNLVQSIVEHIFSKEIEQSAWTVECALEILEVLTLLPEVGRASSSSTAEMALTFVERDVVYGCIKEKGLQHLVALLGTGPTNHRLLAARIMANIIEGSVECFSIAKTLNGLIPAFFELAGGVPDSRYVGLKGLRLLAKSPSDNSGRDNGHCTAIVDNSQVHEVLVGVLMELIRKGIGLEESFVALESVMASHKGMVPDLLGDISRLVTSLSHMPTGAGSNALVKILLSLFRLEIADSLTTTLTDHQIRVIVLQCLEIIKVAFDRENEGQENCILLLGFVTKVYEWRLEPNQVSYLLDILVEGSASSESRIEILEILAEHREKKHFKESLCADKLRKLLTFIDDDSFCKSYGVIAIERFAKTDAIRDVLKERFTLKQLVRVFRSDLDKRRADEARASAAALMGILASDTERESQQVMIEAMTHLVEYLRRQTLLLRTERAAEVLTVTLLPHAERAAEALTVLISKSVDVAQTWVASEPNLVRVVVQVARLSGDLTLRGKLYESLAQVCENVDCHKAVIQAEGHLLLLDALKLGRQAEAVALAGLLTHEEACSGLDINSVVTIMKDSLKRRPSLTMLEAFGMLCSSVFTGLSVAKNGGVEVLLGVINRCAGGPDCQSADAVALHTAAAVALLKLASVQSDSDVDTDAAAGQMTAVVSGSCKAQIVAKGGVDVLLGIARSGCIEAVEVLCVLAVETSAKVQLARRAPELRSLYLKGGKVEKLVLKILVHLSRGLSRDSIFSLLTAKFPELLLGELNKRPGPDLSPDAFAVVRYLSVQSSVFRTAMLQCGEGAVGVLLNVLKETENLVLAEIRECSLVALEAFMEDERARKDLLDGSGIPLLADVLQTIPVEEQVRFYAMKILLHLSNPPLTPEVIRKSTWNQICVSEVITSLCPAMENDKPPGVTVVAIRLLTACATETGQFKALRSRIMDANLLTPLVRLRSSLDDTIFEEANSLVDILAKKSDTLRTALKREIARQRN